MPTDNPCERCGQQKYRDKRSNSIDPRRAEVKNPRPFCNPCYRRLHGTGEGYCPVCRAVKPISEFGAHRRRASGLQVACRTCMAARMQRIRYGITPERYAAILAAQGGTCALCPRTFAEHRACVDHDHSTGRVRGLLCVQCNSALGKLGDTPERLRRALAYVERGGTG